jgi:hypothetical protein
VEEYEYCETTNRRVGIAVIVHDSDDSPFLSPTHFIISPGKHTLVELQSLHVRLHFKCHTYIHLPNHLFTLSFDTHPPSFHIHSFIFVFVCGLVLTLFH